MGARIGSKTTTIIAAVALATASLIGATTPGVAAGADDMVLTLTTTAPSTTVEMPVSGTANSLVIDWGDSSSTGPLNGSVTAQSHVYASAGTYTVRISATSLGGFGSGTGYQGAALITSVSSFGNLGMNDLGWAFLGATSLTDVPATLPASVTRTVYMFESATSFNDADISSWNTANVTNMYGMFRNAAAFNQSLATWNTANVTDMGEMFSGAAAFNQPIGAWNTAKVTNMGLMFAGAAAFNQPLGTWNTGAVTYMGRMFDGATAFNQSLNAWDTSNVTDTSRMFAGATAFNGAISAWNTAKVTDMSQMFFRAVKFNRPIGSWNTSAATTMLGMFSEATEFNQPIGSWNTSNVTVMSSMFILAAAFNRPIGSWDTSNVMSMDYMFASAAAFNQPLGAWNTARVTTFDGMFSGATAFNQSIGAWDTSAVTVMSYMFSGATAFNRPLSTWRTGQVTTMEAMFNGASAFNQPLGTWPIRSVTTMNFMLSGTRLSVANYNSTLTGWSNKPLRKSGVPLGAAGLFYSSAGAVGRSKLENITGWIITDGGVASPASISQVFVSGPMSLKVGARVTALVSGVTGGPVPVIGYDWQARAGTSGSWDSLTGIVGDSTLVLPDEAYGKRVRVIATASNGVGSDTATSPPTIVVAAGPPTKALMATASPRNASAVVSWKAPARTGGPAITRYTVTASPGGRTCTAVGAITCTVTGLTNGTTYTFAVRARNAAGLVGPASDASPAMVAGAPTAPRLLVATVPAAGSAKVAWSAPVFVGSGPITGYQVRWLLPSTATWTAWANNAGRSVTRSGMISGKAYRVQVRAVNASGAGPAAPLVFVQPS